MVVQAQYFYYFYMDSKGSVFREEGHSNNILNIQTTLYPLQMFPLD